MNRPFSVTVYCSSSNDVDERYFRVAETIGKALARRGWRLIYGAGSLGLMGAVARAVHGAGGQVVGVIPHALDQREVTYEACDELLRVETMRQRKALMEENSDAFIALPGGFGTLEEIVEVIVLKQLRYRDFPIVFVNTLGYWEPLIALFDEMIHQGFARPTTRDLFALVESPEEALDYIAGYQPTRSDDLPLPPSDTHDEQVRTALE
jgi:cytokinin riboside 5'-monophosphate phosphoribohydrolase